MAPNPGILKLLTLLWRHMSKRRKGHFVILLFVMLISTFAEVISLGAVLPFLAVLINPAQVTQYRILAWIAPAGIADTPAGLVLPLTVLFVAAALAAGALRIFLLWISTRIAYASASDLSIDLYRRTLYQPYHTHISRNTSEVISGVTHKVNDVAFGILQAIPTLLSSVVLLAAILTTLLLIDPVVASVAALGFSLSYGLVIYASRRRLRRDSRRIALEQTQIIKALQEGLGSIREVLLDGTQAFFCDIYAKAEKPLRKAQGNNLFFSASPRYAVEALGMTLIAVLAYKLSQNNGGLAAALPTLGALALGAQRMLPALQQIYSSWANIYGSQASLVAILKLLDQETPGYAAGNRFSASDFNRSIQLNNVGFRYSSGEADVLQNVSLTIRRGQRIGVVGSTGSGKSTLLDILMGLITPDEGTMTIDGAPLNEEGYQRWQRNIAHIPQNIYLTDSTFAENIAFGMSLSEIDMERVRDAAERAQIRDFIESRPASYLQSIGERGAFMSGGQRQRIGIARALYKRASVLVMDEATSALDSDTENQVMQAILSLDKNLTVVVVTHRLSTVRDCDHIFELENGRLIAEGTYDQLLADSPSFRRKLQHYSSETVDKEASRKEH